MAVAIDVLGDVANLLVFVNGKFNRRGWPGIVVTLSEAKEDMSVLKATPGQEQLTPPINNLMRAIDVIISGIGQKRINDYLTAKTQFKQLAGKPFLFWTRKNQSSRGDVITKLSIFI